MQMVGGNGGNQFRKHDGQNVGNLNGYNDVQNIENQVIQHAVPNLRIQNVGNQDGLIGVPGNANQNPNGNRNLVAARAEANLDEIEEVNANCILMANLQQASTLGTQTDKAPVYDSDGSALVHNYENCYDNEIFNMFTQEDQYTELLEPIPESHQVPQNDNNVIFEVSSAEQNGRTVEQHPANVEETHLNKQLSMEKSTVSSLLEEKKKLKSDFEIREDELLDKQIQLEKRIKELDKILVKTGEAIQTIHMLSPKADSFYHTEQKMALKETLQLAQESRLKMKQLNKEIKPANYTKINHLSGVFVSQMVKSREELYFSNTSKTANVSKIISIPNEEFSDDTTPSVARKFLNESLDNGKVLLEKHDPPFVHNSEEILQFAQESRLKMKQLNKEIKPENYTKINHLLGVFVPQAAKSREELYFSNTSKTANVSEPISIPNEEFLDDTTPSVARKFLNEVKSNIVTLQRVVKQRMTLETHNWSSSAHQELHKIVKDEIFLIVNQVDARVQNFEIQFLKEAAKLVGDFKSLAKEADESLAKHKALELEIKRLLRAVVSQDIISVV
nr:hypothetical protein [Tanacetum cinerariifolium]